jgi:hypothetical protein
MPFDTLPWNFSPRRKRALPCRTACDLIAYGDLAGMVLAVFALAALRGGSRVAVPLTWVFVVATVLDLVSTLLGGLRAGMLGEANDVPWLVLCFYVPALWTTLGLIVWQLVTRRGEPLAEAAKGPKTASGSGAGPVSSSAPS